MDYFLSFLAGCILMFGISLLYMISLYKDYLNLKDAYQRSHKKLKDDYEKLQDSYKAIKMEIKDNKDSCSYDYQDIANYFINKYNKDGKYITHMQLQKLLYFANGIYMVYKDKPLINVQFEAWRYGPVIRELYHEVRGSTEIKNPIKTNSSNNLSNKEVLLLLHSVEETFGKMDAWALSEISYIKEGAWDKAPRLNSKLDNDHIKEEFKNFHIPSLKQNKDC